MKTKDDILKIKAAVLYTLGAFNGELDYVKLFKLLYYAQQHSLSENGRTIFNDTFYALDRGPVPGFVNLVIKRKINNAIPADSDLSTLSNAFRLEHNYIIRALETPDMDELSGSDVACLQYAVDTYGHLTVKELSKKSHNDYGWKIANQRRLADPDQYKITRIEMAKGGNASTEMIEYLRRQIELDNALTR